MPYKRDTYKGALQNAACEPKPPPKRARARAPKRTARRERAHALREPTPGLKEQAKDLGAAKGREIFLHASVLVREIR